MALLQFMPWCQMKKAYKMGEIDLIPYSRSNSTGEFSPETVELIDQILSPYKDIRGRSINKCTIIQYGENDILDDLTEEQMEVTRELVQLVAFSGLANRDSGSYCNLDCFSVYGQRRSSKNKKMIAIISRRRGGRALLAVPIDEVVFSVPPHVSSIKGVDLDEPLLEALGSFRESANPNDWPRLQNAISSFNLANTDSELFNYQTEWILLCSAFERVLGAKSNDKDIATKFTSAITPANGILAPTSRRKIERWQTERPLRYEWMAEFYRVRNDFAHGKLSTRQPIAWNHSEHIFLACIGFPLLVRSILANDSIYNLSETEQSEINALEVLMDQPDFLSEPPDASSILDTYWSKYVSKAENEIFWQKMEEKLKEYMDKEPESPQDREPEIGCKD